GKVVKCGEHLVLVTLTVHNEEKGFNVWKLIVVGGDQPIWKWEQISSTPPDLTWKSFGSLHPTFIVDDINVCILPSASEYMPPLVYNAANNSWYNLPGLVKNVQALSAMELSSTV
ncbi:hypothetical protein GOP47_0009051, partial [Adiantum capillus-veneris]